MFSRKYSIFKKIIIFYVFLVIGISGVSAFAVENIKIAMGYIPNVQFAPYYIAKEMGYFKREGLNVKFDYGMSTDIMSLVSQGVVDFGISDGDQVIVARSKGLRLKAVYSMYVKYPVGIVALKGKGINKVLDLKGHRVGTPGPYGSNYIGIQILLHSAGLSLRDIDLVSIGYTQIESLLSGKVDAAAVYINNEAVVLKNMGKELVIFRVYDVSPMVSAVIVTGDRLIKKNPETIRAFIRAVKLASDYIYGKNGDVMDILKRYIPTLTENNLEINRKVLNESMQLWIDDDVKRHGFGYTSKSDWEKSIQTLIDIGIIKQKINPEDCYTDKFLED